MLIVDDFGTEIEVPKIRNWVVDDFGFALIVERAENV